MTVGLAVLGTGRIVETGYVPAVEAAKGARLVAILSRDQARGDEAARKYGIDAAIPRAAPMPCAIADRHRVTSLPAPISGREAAVTSSLSPPADDLLAGHLLAASIRLQFAGKRSVGKCSSEDGLKAALSKRHGNGELHLAILEANVLNRNRAKPSAHIGVHTKSLLALASF